MVFSETVLFALNLQIHAFTVLVVILLLIVCIATIAVKHTAFGQVRIHGLKGRNIGILTGNNKVLYRQTIGSSDYLYFEAVEVFPPGGIVAPVGLSLQQAAAGDADITTNRYRKESITY